MYFSSPCWRMTGYLGGAVATHVRVADLVLGIFAWAGLYLRDPRLRQLMPIRQLDSIAYRAR
jgi:hypothetical protein